MSTDAMQMLRSRDLCLAEFVAAYPHYARAFHRGRNTLIRFLLHTGLRNRAWAQSRTLLREMFRHDAAYAAGLLALLPARAALNVTRSALRLTPGAAMFLTP
jgi:hypothetical protein